MMTNDDENKQYIHLVIGITGHRDIVDENKDSLKNEIREFFQGLKSKFTNTPLLLLTSLAEGADRIAAQVALEEKINYIVPLPLPIDEYSKDFPNTKEEFSDLLRKSLGYFELPYYESEIKAFSNYGPERNKRYEYAGAYIVRNSQILIALWNGEYVSSKGGTSEIVKFKLKGLPPEYAPNITLLDSQDNGPVFHILTRRRKSLDKTKDYFPERWKIYPDAMNEEYFFGRDGIFSKIDKFNEKIKKLNDDEIEKSRETLASSVKDKEKFVSFIYAEADILAIKYKRRWSLLQIFLISIVGILLGLFLLYINLQIFYLLIIYAAAYITFALMFKVKDLPREYHRNYFDYRAMAEGLRVEFFLRLAGIHEDISNLYLRKHSLHMRWVREVMRSANLFDPQKEPDIEAIKNYWINSQYDYYKNSSEKNFRIERNLTRTSYILFSLGVTSILGAIALNLLYLYNVLSITIALIITLPFFAGLIETYITRSAIKETAYEYSRMKKLFENAINLLKVVDNDQHILIISELGKEALRENADWLLMHDRIPDKIPL